MADGGLRDAYGGGAGGKICRPSLRKTATPYDRPPAGTRNPSAYGRSGWLPKLVDPACRLILSSAARLFSSVFGKRLLGPPAADGRDERGVYESGTGGKIRRRPLRKPATPFDRPLTVIKNPSADGRSGSMSKLVEPASRVTLNNATRLFSSVFGKRVLAPPGAVEREFEPRHELPKDSSITARAQKQGSKHIENTCNNLENVGFDELEELIKQKTFTRLELVHLSQLLSRNVDSFSVKGIERTETDTIHVVPTPLQPKETRSAIVNGTIGSYTERHVIEGDIVSHVELAKAYMSNRCSKVSAPHFQNHTMRKNMTISHTMPSSLSSPSLESARKSSCLTEIGHVTRAPLGRLAMNRMARSPYFRGVDPNDSKLVGASTSSLWSQDKIMLSREKKAMEGDIGSHVELTKAYMGNRCSKVSAPLHLQNRTLRKNMAVFDTMPSSLGSPNLQSTRKSSSLAENDHLIRPPLSKSALYLMARSPYFGRVDPIDGKLVGASTSQWPQNKIILSNNKKETARRILQAVDKLPLSREKMSELKLDQEKPTLKPTLDVLNGQTLSSMKDVGSPKLQNVADIGCLNGPSNTHLLKSENIVSEKEGEVGENDI